MVDIELKQQHAVLRGPNNWWVGCYLAKEV
jgi:hypothetical protein